MPKSRKIWPVTLATPLNVILLDIFVQEICFSNLPNIEPVT
jgi:hypothetical protein